MPRTDDVLDRLASANPGIAAGILLLIALAVLARRVSLRRWPSGPPAHEVVCGAICLALPAFGVVIGGVIGVFHGRYVTFTAAGFAMTIPLVVWWLTTPRRVAEVVACLTVLYGFGHITRHAVQDPSRMPPRLEEHPALVDALGRRPGPLVLSGGVDYLSLWYYAPSDVQPRLLYLADPLGELRETNTDTVDLGYLALARWTPVPAVPLVDFLRTHDRFDLYSLGPDWTIASLTKAGVAFSAIGRDPRGTLYDVRVRPAPAER